MMRLILMLPMVGVVVAFMESPGTGMLIAMVVVVVCTIVTQVLLDEAGL